VARARRRLAAGRDLIVTIDGVPNVVRLYFKKKPLTPDAVSTALRLMERAYRDGASPSGSTVVALLEVSSGRYHEPSTSLAGLDTVLLGEARAFATIYESI
jgi:hypothetical protein